jgi:hypothetical protein
MIREYLNCHVGSYCYPAPQPFLGLVLERAVKAQLEELHNLTLSLVAL